MEFSANEWNAISCSLYDDKSRYYSFIKFKWSLEGKLIWENYWTDMIVIILESNGMYLNDIGACKLLYILLNFILLRILG